MEKSKKKIGRPTVMTQETIDVLLTSWNDEHHLPENLAKILRSELAEQKQ